MKRLIRLLVTVMVLGGWALTGCDQATKIPAGTLVGKQIPPTAASTAVGKLNPTKPSGQATVTATIKPKTVPGSSKGPIAYSAKLDGAFAIYVMNADGSNATRLTDPAFNSIAPSWSPDGEHIVYYSNKGSSDGTGEIYTILADGSGEKRLTNNAFHDFGPAWSPDGATIVFGSNRGGQINLFTISSEGSGEKQITTQAGVETYAKWSPDGKKITFCSDRDSTKYEIYVMNADGSGVQRLTDNENKDTYPVFSPDGKKIAYISDQDGHGEIYVMNADGTNPQRLTNSDKDNIDSLCWSPDGRVILFTSTDAVGANREIFSIMADGSNIRQVTHSIEDKSYVAWTAGNDK